MQTNITTGLLSSFEDSHVFPDGSQRSVVRLPTAVVGLGTYLPGWKWSVHAQTGKSSERHVGYVISGRFTIEDSNGIRQQVGPGEAFEVGPGHDAWVMGETPCVALDFAPLRNA